MSENIVSRGLERLRRNSLVVVLRALQGQFGKGLEWQRDGRGTACDECGGQAVHFIEIQRSVEWTGER